MCHLEAEEKDLQAQVAVMAGALEQIRGYADLRHTALSSEVLISDMATISELCNEALSAAPKVVARLEAKIRRTEDTQALMILFPWVKGETRAIQSWEHEDGNYEKWPGNLVDVLVLAHDQGQGEEEE